jgi:hypothetical protein
MLRSAKYVVLAGGALLALSAPVGALGAGNSASPSGVTIKDPRPMFAVLHSPRQGAAVSAAISTWNYSYVYKGVTYTDAFVGTNPTGGKSTKVPTYIIPIKLKLKTTTADPSSIVTKTTGSPIFKKSINYIQGGTSVGTTQYIDAFQRAALWGTVSTHATYHVLLGTPVVEPEQTLTVPTTQGVVATAFGVKVIVANINWFDPQAQSLISSLGIPANALPIFLTTQSYLSNNSGTSGCCIGGYHNVSGANQPYAMFTYIQKSGAFSQDVSALSHEIGEYVDDPYTNNTDVPPDCTSNRIYEVGDPLETEANYGDYAYTVSGFTYHLQDLVTPVYFGAPTSTSVNGWSTFQGTTLAVCQNGG